MVYDFYECQRCGITYRENVNELPCHDKKEHCWINIKKPWEGPLVKGQVLEAGVKHDRGKPRFDLIPPDALLALAWVLTDGAQKYEPWNWSKGFDWSRLYAALQRHLNAWWGGENKDQESSRSHLWHALACLVFLVCHERRSIGKDDRPKRCWDE